MTPIEILGLDHVDLTVNDVQRSTAFYERLFPALGFRRVATEDYIAWGNGHMNIAIRGPSKQHEGAAFDRYRVGLHHVAFRARSRDEVDRLHQFLLAEGITVLDAPAEYPEYGPNYYAVFFADPDDIKLEVVHFPWGYWRKVMTDGRDERPRFA